MTSDDDFQDPRLSAMGMFVEAFKGVADKVGQVHARHGLSGVDFDTLIRLARSPGRQLRMSELAAQTGLSTSGITRIIDRLEGSSLVRRQPSPGDRRGSLAVLTDDGRNRLSGELPELVEVIERWFTGLLTEDQLDALLAALRTVRQAVRPGAGDEFGQRAGRLVIPSTGSRLDADMVTTLRDADQK